MHLPTLPTVQKQSQDILDTSANTLRCHVPAHMTNCAIGSRDHDIFTTSNNQISMVSGSAARCLNFLHSWELTTRQGFLSASIRLKCFDSSFEELSCHSSSAPGHSKTVTALNYLQSHCWPQMPFNFSMNCMYTIQIPAAAAAGRMILWVSEQSGTPFPQLTFTNLLPGDPESLSSLRDFLIDQSLSHELLCNCTVA